MLVKIIKSTVIDGSVWMVGDVAEVSDDSAKAAIKRGDAIPADDSQASVKPIKPKNA